MKILRANMVLPTLAALWLMLNTGVTFANSGVDDIVASELAPPGVVIEIVMADSAGLSWALPQAQGYIKRLKARFPDMPIAIVTHGNEQFALTRKNQSSAKPVHELTQSLVKEGVEVHVCGTYAGWRGLSASDFPEYVNVSAAGPAQINDYKALEYRHIIIRSED